jgi:2-haloacid dehalogenase
MSHEQRLTGVRAVVFDAYGTLFDWASAAERSQDVLGGRWRDLAELWRTKQLQYTWLRSLMGRHADFWQVTGESLDFALASLGLQTPELRGRLLALYETVDAYPDALPVLAALRGAGRRTAILSNGAPPMLASAVAHAGLGPHLDAVLSVEEVGIYKPHPSVYQLAASRLGVARQEILFVSSNGWDVAGAKAFGFRVAWCNRTSQPPEQIAERPDAEIRTLSEVPGLLVG